jgi:uncharacterized protein (TIGR03067 family)
MPFRGAALIHRKRAAQGSARPGTPFAAVHPDLLRSRVRGAASAEEEMVMRVVILAVALAAALPAVADEADTKALKVLAGKWSVEALSSEGDAVPKKYLKGASLTIKGDRYILDRADGEKPQEWIITLSPNRASKRFHLTRPGETKPAKVGIYELKGDVLKVAVAGVKRKAGPPKSFKPDLSVSTATFKRVKAKK